MENFSRIVTGNVKAPSRSRNKQKRKPRVGKLAHELLNQMSVMQLFCFSLRQQLQNTPSINLRHLDAIEKTLLEAAELANTIQRRLELSGDEESDQTLEIVPGKAGQRKVYPFPRQAPDRGK